MTRHDQGASREDAILTTMRFRAVVLVVTFALPWVALQDARAGYGGTPSSNGLKPLVTVAPKTEKTGGGK